MNHDRLPQVYAADGFWTLLWRSSWESMAIFLLPMVAILATSLITQIEYRSNAWKQVHALPLSLASIFFSKLLVIILMIAQFLALFNLGVYLSAVVPWLLVGGVPCPATPPLRSFLAQDALYFVDCLPIVAAQYLLSLRFKSFLVPIGVGFLAWVGALAALSWRMAYVVPYAYGMLTYLKDAPAGRAIVPTAGVHGFAVGYFVLFTASGYGLFVAKAQKG